jgi:hypothetical protein
MKAIVLTYDDRQCITEHMLKTYALHWPENKFTFRIPYQKQMKWNVSGQSVELVRCPKGIKDTVMTLLQDLPDDEWVYWCIDDKYLIAIDPGAASSLASWVAGVNDRSTAGLCFCRARRLLSPDTVDELSRMLIAGGDRLLLRRNFNQIWLHQFLRVGVLRRLFDAFPDSSFRAAEMDRFKDELAISDEMNIYVTERNYMVLGESTLGGKLTTGCIASMQRFYIEPPKSLEIVQSDIIIGSLGGIIGD